MHTFPRRIDDPSVTRSDSRKLRDFHSQELKRSLYSAAVHDSETRDSLSKDRIFYTQSAQRSSARMTSSREMMPVSLS